MLLRFAQELCARTFGVYFGSWLPGSWQSPWKPRHELVASITLKALSVVRPSKLSDGNPRSVFFSHFAVMWTEASKICFFLHSQLWEILQHILFEFDHVLLFDESCSTRFMVAFACLFPNRKGSCLLPLRTCTVVFHLASGRCWAGRTSLEPKFIATLAATPNPQPPKCLVSKPYQISLGRGSSLLRLA